VDKKGMIKLELCNEIPVVPTARSGRGTNWDNTHNTMAKWFNVCGAGD